MDRPAGGSRPRWISDRLRRRVRVVGGRETVFLTAPEPTIEVLDPAETRLVPDDSAQFTDSILYMESQLRQPVPNNTEIHVGHTAAMDLVDYPLDPARLALARPRQRILIADAVGLGKTLEASVLVSELIARGRGRRILVLAAFGRSEAPILSGVPGLGPDQAIFVFSGLVPNQKSHPLVYEWIAVSFRGAEFSELTPFETLLQRTGLGRRAVPNLQQPADMAALSRLLPEAVSRARAHFVERRNAFEAIVNAKLDEEARALDEFMARHRRQLELDFTQCRQAEQLRQRRSEQASKELDAIYDEYWSWISETMTTEPHPWIKVICAMTALAQ